VAPEEYCCVDSVICFLGGVSLTNVPGQNSHRHHQVPHNGAHQVFNAGSQLMLTRVRVMCEQFDLRWMKMHHHFVCSEAEGVDFCCYAYGQETLQRMLMQMLQQMNTIATRYNQMDLTYVLKFIVYFLCFSMNHKYCTCGFFLFLQLLIIHFKIKQ
jgi:hypothetical protein